MNLDKLLTDQRARRKDLLRTERFVLGDQWDDGRGWTGPHPDGDDTTTALIQRQFVQRNALKEVATRHRDAVVGKEPNWNLTSARPGRKQLAKEAVAALVQWWDANDVLAELQTATLKLLYAEEQARKNEELRPAVSPLRIFLRASSVNEQGVIPTRTNLSEALADIAIHACNPVTAGVLRNADGDVIATRYEYQDESTGQAMLEVTGVASDLAALGLDVTPSEHTIVAVLRGGSIEGEPTRLDLGGRLLLHEMRRREPLITPAAVSQQKLINKAWTMLSHNIDTGGFVERTLLNAQLPGRWVDENGNPASPGEGTFTPEPFKVGAGAVNHVTGVPIERQDGSIDYKDPSIIYRDPVPPETFLETASKAYEALLVECKQLHVLLSADGAASGASRRQATADYLDSLGLTAVQVQGAVRWVLGTVLRLAGVLMGDPDKYDDLDASAQARISVIQPTSEDIAASILKKDAKLISRETAMGEVGVEDPDAELEIIRREETDQPPVERDPPPTDPEADDAAS